MDWEKFMQWLSYSHFWMLPERKRFASLTETDTPERLVIEFNLVEEGSLAYPWKIEFDKRFSSTWGRQLGMRVFQGREKKYDTGPAGGLFSKFVYLLWPPFWYMFLCIIVPHIFKAVIFLPFYLPMATYYRVIELREGMSRNDWWRLQELRRNGLSATSEKAVRLALRQMYSQYWSS
jgi:hypothetical protein